MCMLVGVRVEGWGGARVNFYIRRGGGLFDEKCIFYTDINLKSYE